MDEGPNTRKDKGDAVLDLSTNEGKEESAKRERSRVEEFRRRWTNLLDCSDNDG